VLRLRREAVRGAFAHCRESPIEKPVETPRFRKTPFENLLPHNSKSAIMNYHRATESHHCATKSRHAPRSVCLMFFASLAFVMLIAKPVFSPAQPIAGGLAWGTVSVSGGEHFKYVSNLGRLQIYEYLTKLALTNNAPIPLRLAFQPGISQASPYFGANWRIPLLESIAYPLNANSYKVRMPDGRDLVFYKMGNGTYRHSNVWSAVRTGKNDLLLKSIYGVEVNYETGRLKKIKYPDGEILDFKYDKNRVVEITVGGVSLLKIKSEKGKLIFQAREWTNIRGKTKTVEYEIYLTRVKEGGKLLTRFAGFAKDKVPWTSYNYTPVDKETTKLKKILSPEQIEEMKEHFRRRYPDDLEEEIELHLKEYLAYQGLDFEWNPVTGIIKTMDNWCYTVTPPEYGGGNAKIQRVDVKNKQEEFWYKDIKNGRESILRSDGFMLEKEWFTSGVARGKIKLERSGSKQMGGYYETILYAYDENGRLFRSTENGKDTLHFYDEKGNLGAMVTDGKLSIEIIKGLEKQYKPFLTSKQK
jgi:hypothetical protein